MKSISWLRIASMLSLLFAVGHTAAAIRSWSTIDETNVVRSMQALHFEILGTTRSYPDSYLGFGFIVSVYLLLQALLLWQLAGYSRYRPAHVRPLIASFFLASLALCALTWKFIFPVPLVFSIAITVVLGLAFCAAGRDAALRAEQA